MRSIIGSSLWLVFLVVTTSAQQEAAKPVVPLDPIATIVDAFQIHDIVAMSDAHGNEQNHAFRLQLIRDPKERQLRVVLGDPPIDWDGVRMRDEYQRWLGMPDSYLGPASQMRTKPSHEIPPALCVEPGFVDRQVRRIALAGVPQFEADRLKTYCAAHGSR